DGTIPGALSNIVSKCLERDPGQRYQSAAELLRDLEAWQGNRAAATLGFQPAVDPWGRTIHWPLVTGLAAVLVLAVAGYVFRGPLFSPPAKKAVVSGPALSLAILPLRNASGDPSLNWLGSSFADMLSTDIGQSAQLRTVSPTSVHQIFTDLRISADTLQDIKNDRSVPLKIEIPSEKEIPNAVDQLAESIRQQLALPDNVVKELKASSFQPKSSSIEALRDYDLGIGFQRDGKNLEAQKQFLAATQAD